MVLTGNLMYSLVREPSKAFCYRENDMEKYLNINGNSNIEAYEIGETYIAVKFYRTSKVYVYSYTSAGEENIETMKELARQGNGLNSFIMRNVRTNYER